MLAKRSQIVDAQFLARHSQFTNLLGAGQATANVPPTPLGNLVPPNPYNYENSRLACQAGVNGIQAKISAEHSSIPGPPESVRMIGPTSFLPIQDQPSTAISNKTSALDSRSSAGCATSDLPHVGNPPNEWKGQMPDGTDIEPNSPQGLTDNIASVNAQLGDHNPISEQACGADMMDLDTGSDSTGALVPKNTAEEQNPGTPNRTGTPTSGKPQKPATPSKTTLGIVAQTTPGTPSRAASNGLATSKHFTNDAPRALRASSHASSVSARELKRKRSITPSARACSTAFNSGFESLNDAFRSGSVSHHTRPQAK